MGWAGILVATGTILLSSPVAGEASAATQVRLLHALPGGPAADLAVTGGHGHPVTLRGVGFAQASPIASGPDGAVTLALSAGGKTLVSSRQTLASGGRYTVVAEKGNGDKARLRVYRSGKAVTGRALVRAVNAAPESGRVALTLGSRKWGTASYGQDSGYKAAAPGTYALAARMPRTRSVLVEQKGVNVAAGTASTAYTVGSAGARMRFVVVQDSVAAPARGPATGLGGMADSGGRPWLAALLAALAAGALGGALFGRAPLGRGRARG